MALPFDRYKLWLGTASLMLLMGLPESTSVAQPGSRAAGGGDERQDCEVKLNLIFDAIQAYRRAHLNCLPAKLSDLVPEIIDDPKTLICPVEQKTWSLRSWIRSPSGTFLDPGFDLHASYTYEFNETDLPDNSWRGLPRRTWRDFKRAQMAQLERLGKPGGLVPIVSCLSHHQRLNLGYNGSVYETDRDWETKFAQGEALETLVAGKLFADRNYPKPVTTQDFPPRDPQTSPQLLDLSSYYNAQLSDGWQGFPGNDLTSLPSGLQQLNGVPFDIRGVIQLGGEEAVVIFTNKIEGIAVHQRFSRIHFLHAATFYHFGKEDLASYVIHYANGETNEIPVVYGQNIADWWHDPEELRVGNEEVAWEGTNAAAKAYGKSLRLYKMSWDNPMPNIEVVSISLVSHMSVAAPFVIAITLDLHEFPAYTGETIKRKE